MDKEKVCSWYSVCPMKDFFEEGKLEKHWVEEYCFNNGQNCQRLKAVRENRIVPDNFLPDGTIRKNLK
jgi:hypothetical protein